MATGTRPGLRGIFSAGLPAVWLLSAALTSAAWGSGWLTRQVEAPLQKSNPRIHLAWYWQRACHGVVCSLCPRRCFLPEGGKGWCRVRTNLGGRLFTLVYGRAAAVHVDPVEKKPVFHFLPGSRAFSVATAGCNLACDFCQNWTLSQLDPEQLPTDFLLPQDLVRGALQTGCRSLAYTYSEPVIFYEYMAETARLAHQAGLYNIMISAGYIEPGPLENLLPYLDVLKIDLKGFDPDYYRTVVHGELAPVLRTLKLAAAAGVQLEVVNLLVPTANDDEASVKRLAVWIRDQLGADTPLFFSRFSSGYRLSEIPPTPLEILHRARQTALAAGLHYVYIGNVSGDEGESTYCPHCGLRLVYRNGFAVLENRLRAGRCPRCQERIPGIWEDFRKPGLKISQEGHHVPG